MPLIRICNDDGSGLGQDHSTESNITDSHADFFIRNLIAIRSPRLPRPVPPQPSGECDVVPLP